MDRGESLQEILAAYPAQADRIKPLLMVAMLSRALPQPVPGYTALRMGKNQLLAEMASMQSEDSFIKPKPSKAPRESVVDRLARLLKQLQPAYRFAMVSLVVVLTGGFFTLSASASGLAENIMHTLFFSFEQVSDLLLVSPSPPGIMGDNPIFSGHYHLPDSPDSHSGDLKGLLVGDGDHGQGDQFGEEFLAQIQTRVYSLTTTYDVEEVVVEEEVEEIEDVLDEKDLEKEDKEEEKDLEKEEKDEEKDLKEEEKDEEKEDKEEEKAADKAEKESEKAEDKAEKEDLKIEKEDEKDKDK
jgi:hypothetical protein